jgi:hypothetical protein
MRMSKPYFLLQRFRDSNPFGPQSNDGRLPVLTGDFQSRPEATLPTQDSFVPERFPEISQQNRNPPVRSFAAVPAVLEEPLLEAAFGNRFKSRRPPQFDTRERTPQAEEPQVQPQQTANRRPPPREEDSSFQRTNSFSRRPPPTQQQEEDDSIFTRGPPQSQVIVSFF